MSFELDRLYAMLPAIYRSRDAEQGEPLRALLAIIAEQVAVIEEDMAQLYDDYFIETCNDWVVPYLGDLVGARDLLALADVDVNPRPLVANTLSYRRRMGTAAVLEQLAQDVTGWHVSVVEYFQRLATTQYLNHIRPDHQAIADLRGGKPHRNTPFDPVARTVDVRNIASGRGSHNIPNVGIFLWRIGSHAATNISACKLDERRYLFDPLGKDVQLYSRPQPELEVTHLAQPHNVPMSFSRELLNCELDTYYGRGKSLLLNVDGEDVLPVQENPFANTLRDLIAVCDLRDVKDKGNNVIWAHMPEEKIAIDPMLGRIAFPAGKHPSKALRVTYHYGFSGKIGGGEYARAQSFSHHLQPIVKVDLKESPTLDEALRLLADSGGVVEVQTNDHYYLQEPIVRVPAGKTIELRAADGRRPILVLRHDLTLLGADESVFVVNGLVFSGAGIDVPAKAQESDNRLARLEIRHCTLLPQSPPENSPTGDHRSRPSFVIEAPNAVIAIERSIVGTIRCNQQARCQIFDSIVDAGEPTAVAYAAGDPVQRGAGGALTVESSTIIGKLHTWMMPMASNTIFLAKLSDADSWTAPLVVERLQQGGVRFCYVPPGSRVPRQYNCRPKGTDEAARMRPIFNSLCYGEPDYCQLSDRCAVEIQQGADDQGEMGTFHHLYQPQREANLRKRMDEYLRVGLEAGIFYAS